jgi:hypothetical protein
MTQPTVEKITMINGNRQPYTLGLPLLVIQGFMNDGGLAHILENTGLEFVKGAWDNYSAQPTSSNQIAALFLTYNFKTRYFNNADSKNTLYLKGDHHVGFQVDSICLECVKRNHIHAGNLQEGDHLAC